MKTAQLTDRTDPCVAEIRSAAHCLKGEGLPSSERSSSQWGSVYRNLKCLIRSNRFGEAFEEVYAIIASGVSGREKLYPRLADVSRLAEHRKSAFALLCIETCPGRDCERADKELARAAAAFSVATDMLKGWNDSGVTSSSIHLRDLTARYLELEYADPRFRGNNMIIRYIARGAGILSDQGVSIPSETQALIDRHGLTPSSKIPRYDPWRARVSRSRSPFQALSPQESWAEYPLREPAGAHNSNPPLHFGTRKDDPDPHTARTMRQRDPRHVRPPRFHRKVK